MVLTNVYELGNYGIVEPWGEGWSNTVEFNNNRPDDEDPPKWIWYTSNANSDAPDNRGTPVNIQRTYINNTGATISATLKFIADNVTLVKLNSTNLLPDIDSNGVINMIDGVTANMIQIDLISGNNLLEFEVENAGGPGGLVVSVIKNSDSSKVFYSDSSWSYIIADPPTNIIGIIGDSQVSLTWTAPANNGGYTISNYTVQYSSDYGSTWSTFTDEISTNTYKTVTGLTNGTSYIFQVAAVNAIGTGAYSTLFTLYSPGLSYKYVSGYFYDNPNFFINTTSIIGNNVNNISDLSNGVNNNLSANVGTDLFSIEWTGFFKPTHTGNWTFKTSSDDSSLLWIGQNAVNNYANGQNQPINLMVDNSGLHGPDTREGTINLTQDIYYPIRIQFGENAGDQVMSVSFNCVDNANNILVEETTNGTNYYWSAVPDAPINVSGTIEDSQVSLSWTAPTNTGGSDISDYIIQYSDNNGDTWTTFPDGVSTNTYKTVTGLTNGTNYVFRVAAVNIIGTGAYTISTLYSPGLSYKYVSGDSDITGYFYDNPNFFINKTGIAGNNVNNISDLSNGVNNNPNANVSRENFSIEWIGFFKPTHTGNWTFITSSDDSSLLWIGQDAVNNYTNAQNQPINLLVDNRGIHGEEIREGTINLTKDIYYPIRIQFGQGCCGVGLSVSFTCVDNANNTVVQETTDGANYYRSLQSSTFGTDSAVVTPATVPEQPTITEVTIGNNEVNLTWTAPANNGSAITDYVVEFLPNGGSWTPFSDGVNTNIYTTVTGLTNGTSYTFRVSAKNIIGTGLSSADSTAIIPATVPGQPTITEVTRGNSEVNLTWTAPANNGSAITDYVVEFLPNGGSWTPFSDGVNTNIYTTVTGLTNGTSYTFRVSAKNIIGTGLSSAVSTAIIPATVPGQPTITEVTIGNNEVNLTWTAPINNGGSAITDYIIEFLPNGGLRTTFSHGVNTNTYTTVTGLTNGHSYTFRVASVNAIGTSSYSSSSSAVTPVATPAPAQTIRTLTEFQNGLTLIRSLAVANPSTSIGSVNILSDMLLQSVIAQVYYNNTNAISSLSLNPSTVFKSAPDSATVFVEINSSNNPTTTTNITAKITQRGGTIKIISKIMNTSGTGTFEYTNSNPKELILLAHINETTGEIDEVKSGQIVNGFTIFTVDRFSIWVIYSIPLTASIKTGGDPLICPMYGQTFALASHIEFVNLLSDFTNGIFINGQVGMLEPGDFPQFIYWDSGFTKISDISHVYANSYYRRFYIRYHNEELFIDADTLLTKATSKLNKIRLVKTKPKTGLESISFKKTYPLLESTKQIKIGFGPYLLTLTTDVNTDDRHHLDLLITKPQNVINCSGAFISKDQIIRISDIEGTELYQYDSNPFTSIKFTN